ADPRAERRLPVRHLDEDSATIRQGGANQVEELQDLFFRIVFQYVAEDDQVEWVLRCAQEILHVSLLNRESQVLRRFDLFTADVDPMTVGESEIHQPRQNGSIP